MWAVSMCADPFILNRATHALALSWSCALPLGPCSGPGTYAPAFPKAVLCVKPNNNWIRRLMGKMYVTYVQWSFV